MFEGPWEVASQKTLEENSVIKLGLIVKHKSGAILLRCPKCNAMQFTYSPVIGDDKTPTLTKRIQCGSGYCKRCAIWFGIDAGRTVLFEGTEEKIGTAIPQKLVAAGVKTAPTIEEK